MTLLQVQNAVGDDYTVEREIGRGGMAIVYLAQDHRHNRSVAVKVLREELLGSAHADRFLREIKLEGQLQHPHILPIFDSGSCKGVLYYIMPYVEGETLRARLDREGMLTLEDTLRIGRQVAEALAYAHEKGVIHRDIKPANILLRSGNALVADFGVARALEESAGAALTQTGTVVGTPAYMSPEQAGGETNLDGRSDIYSLGCVLHEMLAGEPPFTGPTTQSVLAKHLNEPAPSLGIVRPDLPAGIVDLVRRALAKVPADRFRIAKDLSAALESQGHLTPLDHGTWVATGKRRTRSRIISAALAAVGILILWFGVRPLISSWTLTGRLQAGLIACFPLASRGDPGPTGQDASIALVRALEGASSLRCTDAWQFLTAQERASPNSLGVARARDIAEEMAADHFILGSTTLWSDSISVTLGLYRTVSGRQVSQASGSAREREFTPEQIAVQALVGLLPALLGAGEDPPDLSFMVRRDPAAVAAWIEGEREYRNLNFSTALEFFSQSVKIDSLMAFAALKGAQAASWRHREALADSLVSLAVRHDTLLSSAERGLAHGLQAYLLGDGATAVEAFDAVLAEEPDWGEAWAALGEAYYHLLPPGLRVPSSAEATFKESIRLEPGFRPPLVHLAEISLRAGDTNPAEGWIARLEGTDAPRTTLRRLRLMLRCVKEGPDKVLWRQAVTEDVVAVLTAGQSLASAGHQLECAERAWRSVLDGGPYDRPSVDPVWGSTLGLTALLVAQGRIRESEALLDSIRASVRGPAANAVPFLELLAATADPRLASRAWAVDSLAKRFFGEDYEAVLPREGYGVASWHASAGQVRAVQQIAHHLGADSTRAARPSHRRRLRGIQAHLSLLVGDTADAVENLQSLLLEPTSGELAWSWDETLPYTRLTLAEVYLKRGQWEQALETAGVFDHPEPVVFLFFLPRSLSIRVEAARALRRPNLAADFQQRSERLRANADR
jgi:serine/threonine-protein kinase